MPGLQERAFREVGGAEQGAGGERGVTLKGW